MIYYMDFMKDFQKRTMWVLLAAAMLTACGKDDDTNYDNGRIELRTGIEALTRSPQLDGTGAGNFQAGDVFTLTLSDGSKSVQKTYTVGSTTLYWQELEVTGDEVAFAGCYPNYAADGGTTFSFDVTKALDEDLLLAPAVSATRGAGKVTMPFRHAMHKLVVKYTSDGSYTEERLNGIRTTLNACTVCTVDMLRGAVTDNSAAAPADYEARTGTEAAWLVVPQKVQGVKLSVALDGQSREFTLPETTSEGTPLTALDGGKTLTVMLRITKDGISVEGTDISGWENQGSIEDEIEM